MKAIPQKTMSHLSWSEIKSNIVLKLMNYILDKAKNFKVGDIRGAFLL